MLSLTKAVRTWPSPVAVIVNMYEPTVVVERVLIVSVEDPGGVKVRGLKVLLEYTGRPFTPRVTGELKPLGASTLTVNVVDIPGPIL